jgi:hypothetical protein
VVRHNWPEGWPTLRTHHSFVSKLLNIPKLATLAKTYPASSKISIVSDADLAKVAYGIYKQKLDEMLRSLEIKLLDIIHEQILNSMIGIELKDSELWKTKLEDLKKGAYNTKIITLLPGTYIPDETLPLSAPFPPKKPISGTVKEISGMLFSIYNEKLKSQY